MKRRAFMQQAACALVATGGMAALKGNESVEAAQEKEIVIPDAEGFDTFVYGSTPGGVAAAVEAARRGDKVLLACPKFNAGGMAASGLCTTDAVRCHLFGGMVQEFIDLVRQHYLDTVGENHPEWKYCREGWFYEPSVAEAAFTKILEGTERLTWWKGYWLNETVVQERKIRGAALEAPDGKVHWVQARTYIDATYEGDLAARAGVPCRVGREGREEFGESRAGIHYMNWRTGKEIKTAQSGEPSIGIQAYCARGIVTNHRKQRIPIEKPDTYEQHLQNYLPVLDDFKTGRVERLSLVLPTRRMPNRRYEVNGVIEGITSPNCPGVSWAWPEADRQMRKVLEKFHIDHVAGLWYFMQNDPHVPEKIAAEARQYGLHAQEFVNNGHWPWQIYVRQGRRIMGREILTQNSFMPDPKTGKTPRVAYPIALGEHSFDVHPCHDRRWMVEGFMEGVLWYPDKAEGPAQPGQIPYGALLPKNIDNLLVPVAMSSTHVAMSVLRMEPVWMTTGQIAGLAAVRAKEQNRNVASIDPTELPKTLNILTDPSA